MTEIDPTQFHLEPDITPLDSRGDETETDLKLNYKVNINI